MAVVLIHCLPQEAAAVALRPALNPAVAVFVFLSGYLTPRERVADVGVFLRRRVGKIAAPYVAWTVVYLVARGGAAPLAVLAAFVVGGGSAQLYYLVVYLQLVLLTPWLFRLLERPTLRVALYAVTPLVLCALCVLRHGGLPADPSVLRIMDPFLSTRLGVGYPHRAVVTWPRRRRPVYACGACRVPCPARD